MWVPLGASVLLCLFGTRLGRWLPPATAVRLLTPAVLLSAVASGFVLAVAGFAVLARVPVVAALGHWSVAGVRGADPVPVAAGVLAGLAAAVLLAAAARRAVRSGRDLVLAALACRRLGPAVAGLVVLDDDKPDAYALPGIGGRVVVSTAMLRALTADERAVLLAHEAAHLTHRHHLYVQVAELAAAANPLLRPAARAVGAAVERWADEVAAAEVQDRRLAARALAHAGLARAGAARRGGAGAVRRRGSTPSAARAGVDGPVLDRARALLAPPPPRRRALAGAVAALMLATGAAVAVTARDTEVRFELAQTAYSSSR